LRFVNFGAALIAAAAVLFVSFFGAGPLPALGRAFNPVTGAWTMAADASSNGAQTLHLKGLAQAARVVLEPDGTAHIVAATDHDLFLAVGYVHAKFRLFQMDLERRQGEGRLAEILGRGDNDGILNNDRFELQLGLLRTAQTEWAEMASDARTRGALEAYAQGVNDRIDEAERQHQLPAMFTLLGYKPQPWTPIDTLIIKGDLTQMESFNDTPVMMALLNKSLGPDLTAEWFPVLPPNQQSPYDPGPYPHASSPTPVAAMVETSDLQAMSDLALYRRLASLAPGLIATGRDSNSWAIAGSKSASGGALMAGDPHLHLTLPAIWFQLTLDSPGYHTSGVSVPGTPLVLIGHNQHISWSLTDAANQQTFFYEEQEASAHPNQYFWQGAWHAYKTVKYDIPVLGGSPDHLVVRLSAHGPVISDRGITTSVWWAGNLPSHDLRNLLDIAQASDFTQFRQALSDWHGSAHNFVYADDKGNIGMISAGLYPQVAKGTPWLPMPGTGEYDITGTIPFDDIPQVYDPPSGVVWSANQRQVAGDYPYYIGTASNFFDPGYRANEINRVLGQSKKFTAADMMALQTDTRDYLASEIVPLLIDALAPETLTGNEKAARDLLARWDDRMEVNSTAATVWWTFWQEYLSETFDPWWKSHNVKVDRSELNDALGQDLEAWSLRDPTNPAFTLVGSAQNAQDVMKAAFHSTVALLGTRLGADPADWTWGRIHERLLRNLAVKDLSYGPVPDRGDAFTPLAAPNFPSENGPSWRMVVDWGTGTYQGIYPGGQSENPASTWYTNRVTTWLDGRYAPMLDAAHAAATPGAVTWSLES
jgi:penicillin G amidase